MEWRRDGVQLLVVYALQLTILAQTSSEIMGEVISASRAGTIASGDGRAGGFRRAEHGAFGHGQNRVVGGEHQLELPNGRLEVAAAVGKPAAADH